MVRSLGLHSSESPRRVRVLLVSSHRLIGEALATTLSASPTLEVLGVLDDPREAEAAAWGEPPHVALLVCLNAAALAARRTLELCAVLPAAKVVMLTPAVDPAALVAGVRAGAAGHLTADCTSAELITVIQRVHAGEVLFSAEHLLDVLRQPAPHELALRLTPRELVVLQAMADGLSVGEAAARLAIQRDTVRTHLKNAMSKLGARSRLEAVLTGLQAEIIELRKANAEGNA